MLVVQHIAPGFLGGLASWLAQSSRLPVHIATDGEYLLPGHVYLAPDGFHMRVVRGLRVALSNEAPRDGLRPSVAHLFGSVTAVLGRAVVGVLLTGMGKDGAAELKLMRDGGATTIAQDRDSSIVHGMPGEAIKLDAASYILPLGEIAAALIALAGRNGKEGERP